MKKIKILIVDDYRENIEALSQLISRDDVEIFSATNADDALELISKNEFGLALLDVQMPVTTGFELATIIRRVKRFTSLPIIFVTAHQNDSSMIFKGYQTGAVDLLFKPLEPDMVRAKVQMFVELAQQRVLLQGHVEELEKLRIEADSANLAKSQFLANMSHEIRTPLAAVMGFAELITRDQATPQEKEECLAAVNRNGKLLMRLIDDILDLSKIEANKLELEHTIFDLNEVLRDVDSTMSFRAQENGVSIHFKYSSTMKSFYISDPVRIKQVLLNIIGNAIKFTPGGKVEVEVTTQPYFTHDKKTLEKIIIKVSDDGVGLTKEQADNLFQPFAQADASTKRRFGGSGLGLVISQKIAQGTGGDIRLASSQPQKGSCFEIELLLEPAQEKEKIIGLKSTSERKTEETNLLRGRRILAVDDSPDNLTLISMFLKGLGVDLTFADSGKSAIAEVSKGDFDLILMDVQMPGMDGHEATSLIRKMNFTKPIIALTAHALRSEHDKCKAAGCDSVLSKPISRAKLIENLRQYLLAT